MLRVATNLFAGIVISTSLLSCTDNPPADFTLTDTSRNRNIHCQVWLADALVNHGFAVAELISSDELQQPTGQ